MTRYVSIRTRDLARNPPPGTWIGAPRRLTGDGNAPEPTLQADYRESESLPADQSDWSGRQVLAIGDPGASARGLVCNFIDIVEVAREEFDAWYNTEHMPAICGIDGVLYGARFIALAGFVPRYMALYLMSDIAISQSQEWMRAARTPWSQRTRQFTTSYRRLSFSRAG